jgi:hypothetical protein
LRSRGIHPLHVDGLVGVGYHVAKARGPGQARGQLCVEVASVRKPLKCVAVAARCAEMKPHAQRDSQIDHDLYRLPEMQDHGIGGVRGGLKRLGRRGQLGIDACQVPLDGRDTLRKDMAIQCAHPRFPSTAA